MPLYVRTILITELPPRVEQACAAHERHLAQLRERGKLRAAGRFAGGDGYLEIIDAEDRLEADAIARSSPLVEQGLASWMLREWVELEWS